ncbi:MAG: hypothetical protein DLM61_27720 [Pseudonocardiales bacterium]|nr:MAG: hypothetical protein DLM61_27720 [Pseudonocardiales bacterium]
MHELIRTTTNVDFARSLEQDLPLTDVVGGALLDAYSVIQHDNIIHAAINGEMVKGKNHEFLDDDSKAE